MITHPKNFNCTSASRRMSIAKPLTTEAFYVIVVITGLFLPVAAQLRVAQLGSNPFLSTELFPQQLRQWPINGIVYTPSYSKLPYWGKIDNPSLRPNANYTSTGLSTEKFSHTAKIYSITNNFSYIHSLSSNTVILIGLDLDLDARYNRAKGVLNSQNSTSEVPFNYFMLHTLGLFSFSGTGAFMIKGVPSGINLQLGTKTTATLDHSLTFTKDGINYTSRRATWGWTTSPCAHIFGLNSPQGDAWLQSGYAKGPLNFVELHAGFTLPFGKSGGRLELIKGLQDYYEWETDSSAFGPDSIINRNFIGHYEKRQWSRASSGVVAQLYTNYILRRHEPFTFNIFGRVGYKSFAEKQALSGNYDVTRGDNQMQRGFSIEVAPNLLIPFDPLFNYIDLAVALQYGYLRMSNTYLRWFRGGQLRTYWDTYTSYYDENAWEPFSYANQHDITAGADFSTMFPLLNMEKTKAGFGLTFLINAGATWTDKNYGSNIENDRSVDFSVKQKRFDYEGRKQFSTGVKFQCQHQKVFGWFEINEPLLQAVRPVTKVTDNSGKQVFYEHEKQPLWLSMHGIRFSAFFTYQMSLPWWGALRRTERAQRMVAHSAAPSQWE